MSDCRVYNWDPESLITCWFNFFTALPLFLPYTIPLKHNWGLRKAPPSLLNIPKFLDLTLISAILDQNQRFNFLGHQFLAMILLTFWAHLDVYFATFIDKLPFLIGWHHHTFSFNGFALHTLHNHIIFSCYILPSPFPCTHQVKSKVFSKISLTKELTISTNVAWIVKNFYNFLSWWQN